MNERFKGEGSVCLLLLRVSACGRSADEREEEIKQMQMTHVTKSFLLCIGDQ